MNTDTLDQATDAELNELFAVEVAETMERIDPQHGEARAYAMKRTGAYRSCEWRDHFTDFATDANAVLPWLEKCGPWKADQSPPDGVWVSVDRPAFAQAYADTFARAAVIALIRARRAGK